MNSQENIGIGATIQKFLENLLISENSNKFPFASYEVHPLLFAINRIE